MRPTGDGGRAVGDPYLKAVFDTVSEPLLILDAQLRVEAANRAFYRTFRLAADEVEGVRLFDLPEGPADIPELRGLLASVLEEDAAFEDYEIEYDSERLGHRILHLNAQQLRETESGSIHVLLALNDVTERVEAEREVRRHRQALARSNEELEQFAYVASHDLQEPLRMVSSYVQLLQRRYEGELDEDADEFIHYAVDGALRMKRLINDLLAYSRVGRSGDDFGSVDLEQVYADVVENLHLRIEEVGGRVQRGTLPVVHGSPSQLRHLFENLLQNALEHRGEAPPRIRVEAAPEGDGGWRMTVRDNGPGIPPEDRERVFEIFRRLKPAGEGSGSGIGLAICRKVVSRHGGRIWIESGPGEGAAFHFTLPRDRSSAEGART